MIQVPRDDRSVIGQWWWTVDRWSLGALVLLIMVLIALSVLLPSYRSRQTEERLADLARPTLRVLGELARCEAELVTTGSPPHR